jgi:hypothetical protein
VCGGLSATNELLSGCTVLDPSNDWQYTVIVQPAAATPRCDHTSIMYGDFLLLYGGQQNMTDPTVPEVFISGQWAPVVGNFTGVVPPARWGHTAVLAPDGTSWVVFGGSTMDEEPMQLNDVAVLALGDGRTPTFTWSLPATSGARPPPRYYHSAAVYGSQMIVYGGRSGGFLLDDVYTLQLSGAGAWAWALAPAANAPSLWGHRAVVSGAMMIVFGGNLASETGTGVTVLDVPSWTWSQPAVQGGWPHTPFRADALLLSANGDAMPELVVFGGQDAVTSATGNGLAVLSQIGVLTAPASTMLPLILGGCAGGVFLLCVLAVIGWRTRKAPRTLMAAAVGDDDLANARAANFGYARGGTGSPSEYGYGAGEGAGPRGAAAWRLRASGAAGGGDGGAGHAELLSSTEQDLHDGGDETTFRF